MEPDFDFGAALVRMRNGRAVARKGWNGRHVIALAELGSDGFSQDPNTLPYIFILPEGGGRVPWLASQTDMLADDWFEVA
jgi:hypothetical protein